MPAPSAPIASATSAAKLSITTTCPGRSAGQSTSYKYVRKTLLSVVTSLSSRKTRLSGAMLAICFPHAALFASPSTVSCSAACRLFSPAAAHLQKHCAQPLNTNEDRMHVLKLDLQLGVSRLGNSRAFPPSCASRCSSPRRWPPTFADCRLPSRTPDTDSRANRSNMLAPSCLADSFQSDFIVSGIGLEERHERICKQLHPSFVWMVNCVKHQRIVRNALPPQPSVAQRGIG